MSPKSQRLTAEVGSETSKQVHNIGLENLAFTWGSGFRNIANNDIMFANGVLRSSVYLQERIKT